MNLGTHRKYLDDKAILWEIFIEGYGPRARALLFNRLRPKGLRVVPRPKFCAESENPFLTNGRWWVRREIGIFGWFWHFLYVNLHNVSHYQISVRSWQIWYHIEALNRGSSLMCRFGGFSGCHGNGSHELSKNRGKMGIFCNLCVT